MLDKNDLRLIDNLLVKRIGEELKPIKEDIGLLKKELKPIKDDISHIRKDMKTIINYFDEAHLNLSVS